MMLVVIALAAWVFLSAVTVLVFVWLRRSSGLTQDGTPPQERDDVLLPDRFSR